MNNVFRFDLIKLSYYFIALVPLAILLRSAFLNSFLVLISLLFFFLIIKRKVYLNIYKNLWFFIFIVFWIYLMINSLFAIDDQKAFQSAISQIRFFMFALFIGFIPFKEEKKIIKTIYFLSLIIFFVSFDTIYQYFFVTDIFGLKPNYELNPYRLSGPFGKELIVGTYIAFLSAPLISFFIFNIKKKEKLKSFIFLIFIIFTLIAVILSGERMSLLFYLANILLILFLASNKKIFVLNLSILIGILVLMYNFNPNAKNRFNNFYFDVSNFKDSNHARVFSAAYNIWEKNKIFGVGLKNYRILCDDEKIDKITNKNSLCSTHPHNIYIEILTETGLLGLFLFLFFMIAIFIHIKKNYNNVENSLKPIFFGSLSVILFYLWPIKSSGSFFSTFTATFFWFNLGMIFLITKKNDTI